MDGTVNSTHWNIRHTDPDPDVRAEALDSLKGALRFTHAVGGNTALLVIGRGSDGSEDEIWKRSIDNISKAVPLAAELGIHIAIENVWNQFLYDHEGDSTQTADKRQQMAVVLISRFSHCHRSGTKLPAIMATAWDDRPFPLSGQPPDDASWQQYEASVR